MCTLGKGEDEGVFVATDDSEVASPTDLLNGNPLVTSEKRALVVKLGNVDGSHPRHN